MPDTLRVASFNVENLFARAKVFNFDDPSIGNWVLAAIDVLQQLLAQSHYSAADKEEILRLYHDLSPYIEIREDRGKLFRRQGWAVTGVVANGVRDWDGTIDFKMAEFSDAARVNTAQVIKDTRADVLCIVEAESRPVLRAFDSHLLNNRYRYELLIDGNDPRGIDVGVLSKYALGHVWTHMFDREGSAAIFSRDCLEVEILLSETRKLFLLCNHFKSKGYDPTNTSSQKRERQARKVANILEKYDLTTDWVIVAGDLNDTALSPPLQPLLTVPELYDVLALQFRDAPSRRWTYHYQAFEQIDFVLVSRPLKDRFRKAGVIRKGIHDLRNLTASSGGTVIVEDGYPGVTRPGDAASDHGAVWAEFSLA